MGQFHFPGSDSVEQLETKPTTIWKQLSFLSGSSFAPNVKKSISKQQQQSIWIIICLQLKEMKIMFTHPTVVCHSSISITFFAGFVTKCSNFLTLVSPMLSPTPIFTIWFKNQQVWPQPTLMLFLILLPPSLAMLPPTLVFTFDKLRSSGGKNFKKVFNHHQSTLCLLYLSFFLPDSRFVSFLPIQDLLFAENLKQNAFPLKSDNWTEMEKITVI